MCIHSIEDAKIQRVYTEKCVRKRVGRLVRAKKSKKSLRQCPKCTDDGTVLAKSKEKMSSHTVVSAIIVISSVIVRKDLVFDFVIHYAVVVHIEKIFVLSLLRAFLGFLFV